MPTRWFEQWNGLLSLGFLSSKMIMGSSFNGPAVSAVTSQRVRPRIEALEESNVPGHLPRDLGIRILVTELSHLHRLPNREVVED